MRPASRTAPWTGIAEVRRIGPGTRIGWTFFKVFVTTKGNYRKNPTPSNQVILVWSWVKSLLNQHAASVRDRPLNGHNWGTPDWRGYPHWLNLLQGICDKKTYLTKKRNTLKSSNFRLNMGKIAIPLTCGQCHRPPLERAQLGNGGLARVPALVERSSGYFWQ